MPELPDIELYLRALERRLLGRSVVAVRGVSPFVVRTFEPPLETIVGQEILRLRRLGKQIIWELEGELSLVFHLMISGRLRWKKPGATVPGSVAGSVFYGLLVSFQRTAWR